MGGWVEGALGADATRPCRGRCERAPELSTRTGCPAPAAADAPGAAAAAAAAGTLSLTRPMQVPTQGQWWSNLSTQLSHTAQ